MNYRIEVATKPEYYCAAAEGVLSDIKALGVASVEKVKFIQVYYIEGEFKKDEMDLICRKLLTDSVTSQYRFDGAIDVNLPERARIVEVRKKPGVMDPVEASTLKGIGDLGLSAESVKTARKYIILGNVKDEELNLIASKVLANDSIEEIVSGAEGPPVKKIVSSYTFKRIEVPLSGLDDGELIRLAKERQLFLNLNEMKAIRDYFKKSGREPTDVELETIAQTWSEHCCHKTFRGLIDYDGETIDNLLASTVMKVTEELNKSWCISVFKDNAGIIEFDEDYGVCFKVETHNHPSAIEPYGGAGTGIGGVIRDPMGTGLGAKPIFSTDIFCFANPDYPYSKLPKGVLHPKKIFKGVVAGVRDYGNRMGIPTINGAIYFGDRYLGNPLVYCGNAGLIPRDKCFKEVRPGDAVVLVGGRTGRDGIHGATFSSGELTEESEMVSSGAVQIGNPITEKKMLDVLLVARDRGLYRAVTDCGGGGLSSAVGEIGEDTGVEVNLEKVPLKYEGISYMEIWISEAQERMIIVVPPEKVEEVLKLFSAEDVEAVVIGKFTDDKRLKLYYEGNCVSDLDMHFLHRGVPRLTRKAIWKEKKFPEPILQEKRIYNEDLHRILSSYNVCSKEWVVRQYDHEVQGASVLKGLVGEKNDGPGDASIVAPVFGSKKGVIVSCGFNPMYSDIDPYWMAAGAIDEAVRQIIAVGGSLRRLALLDNFCWGNTDKSDRLGGLVRAAKACYDIARVYGTPFISGKDSLNNEYATAEGTIVIPGSLLISAIAVMDDVSKAISMDLKKPGNLIYIVGTTKRELGGSHYYFINGFTGNGVPKVEAKGALAIFRGISRATDKGLVRSCHDLSEGGLAVALAEMAFAGGFGAKVGLKDVPVSSDVDRDDTILFSESNSRFLVEVEPENRERFEETTGKVPFAHIGQVTAEGRLVIKGARGNPVIDEGISALKESWQKPLRW